VTTVLYRTLTFNECKEASDELQEEIKLARADLKTKGMKFDD
jgi:dolichol-phosphate mannosyltransferase subunit 3